MKLYMMFAAWLAFVIVAAVIALLTLPMAAPRVRL
jgi:hypothetical protein